MSPVVVTTHAQTRDVTVVAPMLTRRRPVDFCRVAASLCRCA